MDSPDAFHSLVADLDYPMFVVTACEGSERAGCLVGFLTQASIDPPRLLVLISKANRTYRVASRAAELAVHVLQETNRDLARLFGEQSGDEVDKFSACEWEPSESGTPLLRGTKGWVLVRVLDRVDAGDHVAHLVEPIDARVEGCGDQLGFQAVKQLKPGHPA